MTPRTLPCRRKALRPCPTLHKTHKMQAFFAMRAPSMDSRRGCTPPRTASRTTQLALCLPSRSARRLPVASQTMEFCPSLLTRSAPQPRARLCSMSWRRRSTLPLPRVPRHFLRRSPRRSWGPWLMPQRMCTSAMPQCTGTYRRPAPCSSTDTWEPPARRTGKQPVYSTAARARRPLAPSPRGTRRRPPPRVRVYSRAPLRARRPARAPRPAPTPEPLGAARRRRHSETRVGAPKYRREAVP
mmetsp:Transcript_59971/g.165985  ORF Transcript_59971/g.165985 Transcript_59971/m.165985 type:complete len:242 (-) Transcript_59971:54-779(-)